ncbi:hypothetical protein KFE98_12395 [bacterium SCSIO 12741]|nr:hypothetical protein KFE98_12395 [bacterium SCSIO 12741]
MLGLILVYFIGKRFYDLAEKHDKHKWGFAIAGVASYYLGTMAFGFFLALYSEIWNPTLLEGTNDFAVGLMGVPFGVLACVGFYKLLKRSWEPKSVPLDSNVLDAEIDQDSFQRKEDKEK